jgi:hypothetical protein
MRGIPTSVIDLNPYYEFSSIASRFALSLDPRLRLRSFMASPLRERIIPKITKLRFFGAFILSSSPIQ